jgi:hypothetical protein
MRRPRQFALVLLLFLGVLTEARAGAAVLLGEPYGGLAKVSPTGHVAIYLDRVCAASPIELRRCRPGEFGVVISRYNKINGYDWIAIPLIPYLYAVDRAEEVPDFVDAKTVALLRNRYRRRYLLELVPDRPDGRSPNGDWLQLIGAAYDRRLYAFEIETSAARDDQLVALFNSRRNKRRFNGLFRNCADFAKDLINFYYPKSIRRSIVADVGLTTPKQVAKSLVKYSKKHPELHFSGFVIEQVPGKLPRSTHVRGVMEALVKTKKYAVPMVLVHFALTPALAVGYFTTGRFNPKKHARVAYDAVALEQRALLANGSILAAASPEQSLSFSFLRDPCPAGYW